MVYHILNYMSNIKWQMPLYFQIIEKVIVPSEDRVYCAYGYHYFLFVDLHKEADIKDSINFQDEFINERFFQWQSPKSTAQSSERGKNIIYNKDRNIHLHLFIRKYKQFDGTTEPYIYIGKGNTVS